MILKEENRDLFLVPDDYYLVHCISADFAMGKGIVLEFNKRFNLKKILIEKYKNNLNQYIKINGFIAQCILEGRVLNLITKEKYWNKPTYDTITEALYHMKLRIQENNIKKIAMPLIGCGLDGLNWNAVKKCIEIVFGEYDIEILVCYL